jgi:tRNA modification GTPase
VPPAAAAARLLLAAQSIRPHFFRGFYSTHTCSTRAPLFGMISQDKINMDQYRDTIAAIATAAGQGGIGIVRISGPKAWQVGRALFRPAKGSLTDPPPARRLIYGHVIEPGTSEIVDEALTSFFKAPHTYSTEDTVEIQGHAGPAVTQRVLSLCLAQGCRLAEPGEFTRRAYLGGRLDLSQAEAVAQLIAAASQSEARLALGALQGGLARELAPVRQALLNIAAAVEAALDFPDEVADIISPDLAGRLEQEAAAPLARLLDVSQRRRVFREGAVVVLCGRPNVGKSSLFNRLLGERRAIVTARPGTTRDAIEEAALLGGVVCRLVDTAGLTDSSDEVEALGVELAKGRLGQADLALLVLDQSQPLNDEDRAALEATHNLPRIIALNKSDKPSAWDVSELGQPAEHVFRLSAKHGQGLDELSAALGKTVAGGAAEPKPGEVVAGARQREALGRCLQSIQRAAAGLSESDIAIELVSLDLSEALAALGEVDGQGAPDEVIDTVFEKFCVGK